jgi:hypothetical protein
MIREWIVRAGVALHPWEIRHERGAELRGTLLDAGDGSRRDFAREALSVAGCGLLARSASELRWPVRQIAASALCWAAVMSVVMFSVGNAATELRPSPGTIEGTHIFVLLFSYLLPPLIMVMISTHLDRAAGITGVAWVASWFGMMSSISHGIAVNVVLSNFLLPAMGFVLLTVRPPESLSAGRLLWVPVAVVWFTWSLTPFALRSGVGETTLVIAALLLLLWAPSLAVGTALAWGLPHILELTNAVGWSPSAVWVIEAFAGIPLAIIIAWAARRSTANTQ